MPPPALSSIIDALTLQSVVASRWLAGLYRRLQDPRQAMQAIQAGAPAEERARRLGITSRGPEASTAFANQIANEEEGERLAWITLIQAQAGICAFHGVVDGQENAKSLRGPRTAAHRAFEGAIRGFRTAFPEEISKPGIETAIEDAAIRCSQTFVNDLDDEPDVEGVLRAIREEILIALRQAVASMDGSAL